MQKLTTFINATSLHVNLELTLLNIEHFFTAKKVTFKQHLPLFKVEFIESWTATLIISEVNIKR